MGLEFDFSKSNINMNPPSNVRDQALVGEEEEEDEEVEE